jgi:multisubunit Na+/H+ antiporter MnhF subunit
MICVSCIGQLLGQLPYFKFPSFSMGILAMISVLVTIITAILGLLGILGLDAGYPNSGLVLAIISGIAAVRLDALDSRKDGDG